MIFFFFFFEEVFEMNYENNIINVNNNVSELWKQ